MSHQVVDPIHRMAKHKRLEARAATTTARTTTANRHTTQGNNANNAQTTTARVRTTATTAAGAGADADANTATASQVQMLPSLQASAAPISTSQASQVTATPSVDAADTTPSASPAHKELSGGAKAGIAIGVILAVAVFGVLGFLFYKKRKARLGGQAADYSWSSREKDVNFGMSPSRNVKSDASFGNSGGIGGFSGFRRLSNGSDTQTAAVPVAAAAAPAVSAPTSSNATAPAGAFNAPRASFMNGPANPPPSVGALYGAAPASAAGQQNPFVDPPYADKPIYVVRRTFEPSLADELIIYPGDRIQILVSYDDGWCLGINLDSAKPGQTPQRGVFPKDCVEEVSLDVANGNRTGLRRAPTLPPMNFEKTVATSTMPAIQVSSPESLEGRQAGVSLIDRFPSAPNHRQSTNSQKRTSSMIAGKDNDLFSQMRFDDR